MAKLRNHNKMMKLSKQGAQFLHALPSMGMVFIVLGVLLMAITFALHVKGNILLLVGLFFILAGAAGVVLKVKG